MDTLCPDTTLFRSGSLQGKFLVANPALSDPRFAHAVILMVKHDATGAFGLIINRPVGIAEVTPDKPAGKGGDGGPPASRSEEHKSELQSLMRIAYAVYCLKKKTETTELK